MLGASNGWYKGAQIFACPDSKAVFVPFNQFGLDERFSSSPNEEGEDIQVSIPKLFYIRPTCFWCTLMHALLQLRIPCLDISDSILVFGVEK